MIRNKEKYLIAIGKLVKRAKNSAIKSTCSQKFSINPVSRPVVVSSTYSLIDDTVKEFLLLPNIKQLLDEYRHSKNVIEPKEEVKQQEIKEEEEEEEYEEEYFEQEEMDRLSEDRREFLCEKFKKDKKLLVECSKQHYGLDIKDVKNKTVEKIVKLVNDEEIKRRLFEDFKF